MAVTEENWRVVAERRVYGSPRPLEGLVKPGDVVIFYVRKRGSGRLGGKFVGAFRVASGWYRGEGPLWPDEVREGRVKYPWRVRLAPVKLGVADFEELVPRLRFVRRKDRPHAYLVGTPANLRRPVPEEDAELILGSMR